MLTEKQILRAPRKDYMNEAQLEFFRHRLKDLRGETITRIDRLRAELSEEHRECDELDRASVEEDTRLKVREVSRASKLLPKIEEALCRIEDGSYGYCADSGDPIGTERLLLRPTAEYGTTAKAQREDIEHTHRDLDVDA